MCVSLTAVILATGLPAGAQAPSPSPKDMYAAAQARELQLRSALAQSASTLSSTLRDYRAAIDAYRAIVWRYPTSGYCDNALWQGAHLAVDAFARFGEERDRQTAIAMLKALVSEYPSSAFVAKARAEASQLELPSAKTPSRSEPKRADEAPPPATEPARDAAARKEAPSIAEPPTVSIQRITRATTPEAVEVIVELDGPTTYREERLDGPPRVFFDLANTRAIDALRDAVLTYDTDVVRQIRVGRHPNQVTRIVLELDGVARYSVKMAREPYRLIIDCYRTAPPPGLPAVKPAPPSDPGKAIGPSGASVRPVVPGAARETPSVLPSVPAGPRIAPRHSPEPPLLPPTIQGKLVLLEPAPKADAAPISPAPPGADRGKAPALAAAPDPPTSNLSGGYSLARQLGLGVGRIVIDPGHGGRDPGAVGAGVTEADMTLDIALRLEKLLVKEPGIEVVMTRRTDVYVPLEERTAIANRAGADLFLSIHCNAAKDPLIHGVETYSLNFASTAHAATVAARENASAALPMGSLSEIVRVIALNSKVDESRDLARQVQLSLVRRLRVQSQAVRDLGVKQAPFVVLIGAAMPSVLAEVAFITNPQEGRLLANANYRQRAAEALLEGISRYQRSLKKNSVPSELPIAK